MNGLLNELMVVLVIYKMKISESPTYQSLTKALQTVKQSTSIFIYDNSPSLQETVANTSWQIFYHHNALNAGVSKAYNEGFKIAQSKNKKWLLLVDQDTVFPVDFFQKLASAASQNQTQQLLAPIIKSESMVVSPFLFSYGRGRAFSAKRKLYLIDQVKIINSGMIISVNLFEKSNGFDERFSLDFSDLDFLQRAKKVHNEFMVINAICTHKLSSESNSYSEMLSRFPYFLRASKLYGKLYGGSIFLFLNRLVRAIKLSFHFGSWDFIKSFGRIEQEQIL